MHPNVRQSLNVCVTIQSIMTSRVFISWRLLLKFYSNANLNNLQKISDPVSFPSLHFDCAKLKFCTPHLLKFNIVKLFTLFNEN